MTGHETPPNWLLVVAAPAEAAAVLDGLDSQAGTMAEWESQAVGEGLDLLTTGVGKANAAAAVGIALRSRTYSGVINLGIAGALPAASPLELGSAIAATRSVYADEGLTMPDGSFVGCAEMGFPLGPFDDMGVQADRELLGLVTPLVVRDAPIATVSTCSGTDALARTVVERTGAAAEAMEGAAVGHVASRLGVPFLELRVISNTTGDRGSQVWAVSQALGALGELAAGVGHLARSR